MKYAALLLVMSTVQFPQKTVHLDILECNHYGPNQTQLIAWEIREGQPYNYPTDWTTTVCGSWDNGAWHDRNGKTIVARQYVETWTEHDPERRAFQWWRANGETRKQEGIWK